jgi:thiamine-phosphate pyrophosphorylase
MPDEAAIHRILDAELNRAGEGLRVIEDYVRFVLDDAHLTGLVKQLRHDFAKAASDVLVARRHAARDTPGDVGTEITTPRESIRADAWAVCAASLERTKQSFRSLEEFGKTVAPSFAAQIEALRYRLYTIEAAVGRTADAVERLAGVRLYVLIDGGPSEKAFGKLVGELVDAGVDAIQLRDKQLSDRELAMRGRIAKDALGDSRLDFSSSGSLPSAGRAGEGGPQHARPLHSPLPGPPHRGEGIGRIDILRSTALERPLLIINDRPDVAAAVDADGVQLGQHDISVKDARAILGPHKLIGVSTHSIEQARAAVLAGANYIGVGPTFPSQTKAFDEFPGLDLVRQVAAEIRLPAFAIGGITLENLSHVQTAGAARIAVSSAIATAHSPADSARRFKSMLASTPAAPVEQA